MYFYHVTGRFLVLDGSEKEVEKSLRDTRFSEREIIFPLFPNNTVLRRTIWWACAAKLFNEFVSVSRGVNKLFYWGPRRFLRLFLREASDWDDLQPVFWSHWERSRERDTMRFYGALGVYMPGSIKEFAIPTHLGNRFFKELLEKEVENAGDKLISRGKPWPTPEEELKSSKGTQKITLAMIVKNEEDFIAGCLEQALPYIDSIIITDTGSNDRTAEIAACYGARILQYEWRSDFAAARNAYLEKIQDGWVLTLDADEYLTPEAGFWLRCLAERGEPKVFYFRTYNYHSELLAHFSDQANIRLFRCVPDARYEGEIHEQLVTSLPRELVGGPFVMHYGYLPNVLQKKQKVLRNTKILDEIADQARSSFDWYNYGLTLLSSGKALEALQALERYFEFETPEAIKNRPSALWHAAQAALACGKNELALEYAERSCEVPLPDCYFTKAQVFEALGRAAEAIAAYREAAELPDPPASIYQIFNQSDTSIKLWRARLAAASLLEKEKRYAEAEHEYKKVLEKDTTNIFALIGLARTKRLQGKCRDALKWAKRAVDTNGNVLEARAEYTECLISLGDFGEAESFVEASVKESRAFSGLYLHLAQELHSSKRWLDGIRVTEKYLEFEPDHVPTLLIYSRCLWNTDRWEKAQEILNKALELAPEDAEVTNCYGSFLLARGFVDKSKEYIEKALSMKPESGRIKLNLAKVYVLLGDLKTALSLAQPLINLGEDDDIKSEARIFSARCLIANGSSEEAIHLLEEGETFQDTVLKQEALLVKGNAFYALGMHLEAVDCYWEAFKLNAEDAELMFRIALVMIKLNRLEDAENALLRLQEINPSYPESEKLVKLINLQKRL